MPREVFKAARFVAFSALVASASAACSYDLDRLRGHPDGSIDDQGDDITDDTGNTDEDVIPPVDAPPVCTSRSMPAANVSAAGSLIGGTWTIQGSTQFDQSLLTPPTIAGCPIDYSMGPTNEHVYAYTVVQGPRLFATTDAPPCSGLGAFDTVLYARSSCDPAGINYQCDDDDHNLSTCGAQVGLSSQILLDHLSPGDVVYLVVDGYMGNSGSFRLNVTENGLLNALPNTTLVNPERRCGCPSSTDNMIQAVGFPTSSDVMRDGSMNPVTHLAQPGDRLVGTHPLPFLSIAGVTLEFQLTENSLCATGQATFDLLIEGQQVDSFIIDGGAQIGTQLRASLQTFGRISRSFQGSPTSIELRLRDFGAGCRGSFQFDTTTNAGTLTLLGGI